MQVQRQEVVARLLAPLGERALRDLGVGEPGPLRAQASQAGHVGNGFDVEDEHRRHAPILLSRRGVPRKRCRGASEDRVASDAAGRQRALEPRERVLLDLPDAFARERQFDGEGVERGRLLLVEPEPPLDDQPLLVRQAA